MTLTIGLTGGIASGKSTISRMLIEMGVPVIDADVIAREVVEVGQSAYEQIVKVFGNEILLEDRTINREKLGSIIFNDPSKREQLNKIVHPAVRKSMLEKKEFFINQGEKAIILDIPLLFESKLTYLVDKTLVVYVDDHIQMERLMNRNHYTEEEAKARVASQMPLKQKLTFADAVINNNGTKQNSKKQLIEILKRWKIC